MSLIDFIITTTLCLTGGVIILSFFGGVLVKREPILTKEERYSLKRRETDERTN